MVRKFFFLIIPIFIILIFYFWTQSLNQTKSNAQVVVYSYSSFASDWGAGPKLKELFQKKTNLEVEFVDAGDAGTIIQRLILENGKNSPDIVLGLDQFNLPFAKEKLNWKEIEYTPDFENKNIKNLKQDNFIIYNWAPMGFIYKKENPSPQNLNHFENPNHTLSLMDPRTSTPGYVFFHWILSHFGSENIKNYFDKIKSSIVTVSPSWSAAYGLFKKNQAKYVFSYATSPLYHQIEENDFSYTFSNLNMDVPAHFEYAGILETCRNCKEAQVFIDFLFSPEAQEIIMKKNYMLPARSSVQQGTAFENLENIKTSEPQKYFPREEVFKIWKSLSL